MGDIKKTVSISLDTELLKRIDEQRGLIPRSRFITHNLKTALKISNGRDVDTNG